MAAASVFEQTFWIRGKCIHEQAPVQMSAQGVRLTEAPIAASLPARSS
jgi:hypothetical protein